MNSLRGVLHFMLKCMNFVNSQRVLNQKEIHCSVLKSSPRGISIQTF